MTRLQNCGLYSPFNWLLQKLRCNLMKLKIPRFSTSSSRLKIYFGMWCLGALIPEPDILDPTLVKITVICTGSWSWSFLSGTDLSSILMPQTGRQCWVPNDCSPDGRLGTLAYTDSEFTIWLARSSSLLSSFDFARWELQTYIIHPVQQSGGEWEMSCPHGKAESLQIVTPPILPRTPHNIRTRLFHVEKPTPNGTWDKLIR